MPSSYLALSWVDGVKGYAYYYCAAKYHGGKNYA